MSDNAEKVNSQPKQNGGARPGAGRKAKRDKNGTAIQQAERRIRDRLPELVDRMFELANGVLVEVSIDGRSVYQRAPDYKALSYLIDRIMGKPTERKEVSGPDGAPIPFKLYEVAEASPDAWTDDDSAG